MTYSLPGQSRTLESGKLDSRTVSEYFFFSKDNVEANSRLVFENCSGEVGEGVELTLLCRNYFTGCNPPARKCMYRCYIFKGTCSMRRIGLKAVNCTQYPSTISQRHDKGHQ